MAVKIGFLPGIREDHPIPSSFKPEFVDVDFKNHDYERFLNVVKRVRPKYAVVRDIEREEQIDEVLDQAREVSKYAENVIVVPKVASVPCELINDYGYIAGFPMPTKYSEKTLHVNYYIEFDRVHILGGSPHKQAYYHSILNVVSQDGNLFSKVAMRYNMAWFYEKPFWRKMDAPLHSVIATSLRNIFEFFTERFDSLLIEKLKNDYFD